MLEDSGGWQAFCLGQVDQGRRLWEERSGLEVWNIESSMSVQMSTSEGEGLGHWLEIA